MTAGTFIKSTALLNNTYFEDALIYITEYNGNGSAGFIVNRLFARPLTQLEEFKHCMPFNLHEGGPVDTEHLFFMHQRPDLITGGLLVTNNVYVGGDFKQVVRFINNGTITSTDIKMFIGYCGWHLHELEAEIDEGSWVVLPSQQSAFAMLP